MLNVQNIYVIKTFFFFLICERSNPMGHYILSFCKHYGNISLHLNVILNQGIFNLLDATDLQKYVDSYERDPHQIEKI